MKKYILLFWTLILTIPLFAQLEVKPDSFKEVPGFVNINPDENYQTDDNDLPFAVIKIRTENINDKQRRELKFSGNAGTFIMLEYKDGEVWATVIQVFLCGFCKSQNQKNFSPRREAGAVAQRLPLRGKGLSVAL